MIDLTNVTKKYGKNIILNDINIQFYQGYLYVLHGENGAGKSTLLKLLSTQIFKSSGNILLDKSSYLPDKFSFPSLMNTITYVSNALAIDKKKANILLAKYQIPNRRIIALSKGNMQKLGILQILNTNADCYLLDEPIDGLDDFAKRLVIDEIKELIKNNKCVIACMHDHEFFDSLNPIKIIVEGGKVYEKKN